MPERMGIRLEDDAAEMLRTIAREDHRTLAATVTLLVMAEYSRRHSGATTAGAALSPEEQVSLFESVFGRR